MSAKPNTTSARYYRERTRHIEDTMVEVEHNLFDYFGHPEAEHVAVIMGSADNTTQQWMRAQKVGLLMSHTKVEHGGEHNTLHADNNIRQRIDCDADHNAQLYSTVSHSAHREPAHRQPYSTLSPSPFSGFSFCFENSLFDLASFLDMFPYSFASHTHLLSGDAPTRA